jgi:hypothetical protein
MAVEELLAGEDLAGAVVFCEILEISGGAVITCIFEWCV